MTYLRLERHDYAPATARIGATETAEAAARRLRALYPDASRVALVVSTPMGVRVDRYL